MTRTNRSAVLATGATSRVGRLVTCLLLVAFAASSCARARTHDQIADEPLLVLSDDERRSVVAAAAQLFTLAPAAV
ncbi:MAG TPA: hypothetical protein VFW98_07245, partial [Gemmatimonadaceae bacterium]|nr:hypothetical protein [Gemmatimonadaceae bacterium]